MIRFEGRSMRALILSAAAVWLAAGAGTAIAQETEDEERPRAERRQIRVLEHPYDIASFYRSRQGGPAIGYGPPAVPAYEMRDDGYALAGLYRSRSRLELRLSPRGEWEWVRTRAPRGSARPRE
jgi:hypothetical protein